MKKHTQYKQWMMLSVIALPFLGIILYVLTDGFSSGNKLERDRTQQLPSPANVHLPESKWDAYKMKSMQEMQEKESRERDKYFFPKKEQSGSTTTGEWAEIGPADQSSKEASELSAEIRNYLKAEEKEVPMPKKQKVSSSPITRKRKPVIATVPPPESTARFYGMENSSEENVQPEFATTTISAAISRKQKVTQGSVVSIRLLEPLVVSKDIILPKNSFVFGEATLSGTRLYIRISSIVIDKKIYPVDIQVHDNHGMEGIYVPGSMFKDRSTDAIADASSSVPTGLESVSSGVGSALAGAAVNAARSLVSGKVKEEKVYLKAGYKIFLVKN